MQLSQNDREHLIDQVRIGAMTAAEANVRKVQMQRVWIVTRLPAEVRKALNEAVKRGELKHMKKDGMKPEAYYHPTFEHLAKAERCEHERNGLRALARVCI